MSEKAIEEYLLINEPSESQLVCEVTRLISERWRLQGGIAIAANVQIDRNSGLTWTSFSFHQAMVRP